MLTPVECTASGLEVRVYSATKHTFPQECIQESMKCFIDQNKVCSVEHDQGTVQTLHCSIQHVSEQTLFCTVVECTVESTVVECTVESTVVECTVVECTVVECTVESTVVECTVESTVAFYRCQQTLSRHLDPRHAAPVSQVPHPLVFGRQQLQKHRCRCVCSAQPQQHRLSRLVGERDLSCHLSPGTPH